MADSTGTSQDAETPKKKTLLRIVALLLLCVVALAGGFVASVGPQGAMELVGLARMPPRITRPGTGTAQLPRPRRGCRASISL